MASLRKVPMNTKTREHQWVEMRVTPVILCPDDDGNPIAVGDPSKEPQVTVGCFSCNMGMDEGFGIDCPGQDLFSNEELGG